jgi:hypothetical protein
MAWLHRDVATTDATARRSRELVIMYEASQLAFRIATPLSRVRDRERLIPPGHPRGLHAVNCLPHGLSEFSLAKSLKLLGK